MKVIFIADVPNVAMAGQTKEVANGYARNFLFPRKLAVLANSQAAAIVESHLKKVVKQRVIEEAEMTELAKIINGTEITLKAKVGEKDKLYGSVTGSDIAEALSKEIGREIDKRKVDLAEPIRMVGVYDVTIKFTHDITAMVTATVMSDAEGAEKPVRVVEAEVPAGEKKEEKKEKAEKKEKKPKKEKPPKEPGEEKPAADEKAEKPAKEKKPKGEKAKKPAKKDKPAAEEKSSELVKQASVPVAEAEKPAKEEKKEKKSKAKAKKAEEAVEEKKEHAEGE
ncbi:MAG: 50S ribosomal protein L9 [Chloroflexi bacterium RBG_13_51_52]|nr:MAG: 50S ribosomal protein L9 [Chloroflexi bacterium RBG_13_51_52]